MKNIRNKVTKKITRVDDETAIAAIEHGNFHYTTKGAYRSQKNDLIKFSKRSLKKKGE